MMALVLLLASDPSGVYADCDHRHSLTVIKSGPGWVTQWTRFDGREHDLWTYGTMRRKDGLTFAETYYFPDPTHKGAGDILYNPLDRTLTGYGYMMRRLP